MSTDAATPLMRQYHAIKRQVPGALLMFRLGDFYELFYDDAVTASRELGITLTSRNKESGQPIPMCGVPYHAAEGYIARLVARGYRVALCDQMEDPRKARKLVRREITRIVTPGTATETGVLRSRENNYLAAILRERDRAGLAWVDVSTGEFRASETAAEELKEALETLAPREILLPAGAAPLPADASLSAARTEREPWTFDPEQGERILREHFRLVSLDGLGLGGRRLAAGAAGAILEYLRETQRAALEHLEAPRYFDRATAMRLDAVTVRNLELLEPLFPAEMGGLEDACLLGIMDATQTSMGGRLLRSRLLRPSLDLAEIEARLDAVEELFADKWKRGELRHELKAMADLERLLARVTLGTAGPREMLALGRSLERIPRLRQILGAPRTARLREISARMDELADVRERILAAIHPEPPATLADGGAIRDGYHPELDALRDVSRHSRRYLAEIEQRERARTGIASLKVRFNNVFGYYLEVSKANLHLVPPDYERKQTLVGAERFTTPELKELEAKILAAEEKILELEKQIFAELRSFAASQAARIRATAAAIAELDVTAALAEIADVNRYCRPRFNDSGRMLIREGRHPIVENLCLREGTRYIPNDVYLDPAGEFIAVITGPNMGGKSTYLRQAALTAIMAQMGSFVPAAEAELPLIDRVFTRIGASDNLARGRSTFMVEMTETAEILNLATPRSLIILDEVGRGTATFDGLALAWAVVEYIHDRLRAKTLFATHYHELTELAGHLPGVRNLRVSVKESGDDIVFLRKVEPGAADRSYGIEVARLAGLPQAVIERAREVLALHERSEQKVTEELSPRPEPATGPVQIRLFEPVSHQIAERIRNLNLDELRPIEALRILAELQEELKREL